VAILDKGKEIKSKKWKNNLRTLTINSTENPNSCIINIGKRRFRPLLDTGASVLLVSSNIYWSLANPVKLSKPKVCLKSVNDSHLQIEGSIQIEFKIGGLTMSHEFHVVKDINRSFILGRDWQVQNGVRLYYDLGSLRIGKTYVPMVVDIHIPSILHTT
jgi:hypothetical protein